MILRFHSRLNCFSTINIEYIEDIIANGIILKCLGAACYMIINCNISNVWSYIIIVIVVIFTILLFYFKRLLKKLAKNESKVGDLTKNSYLEVKKFFNTTYEILKMLLKERRLMQERNHQPIDEENLNE